jgi:hypothetical protein
MKRTHIELNFEAEKGLTSVTDLSHFLYLFKAAYVFALDLKEYHGLMPKEIYNELDRIKDYFNKRCSYGLRQYEINKAFYTRSFENDILIENIYKGSPLTVTLVVLGGAAIIAAILS